MPSQQLNRILTDVNVDTDKLQGWYDEAKPFVDAKGWSPNESRYWAWCHRYAQRKAMALGCQKVKGDSNDNTNNTDARQSRALQALLKSALSEIEAEKQGIYLG